MRASRHCERSEAIHGAASVKLVCFASLAMTAKHNSASRRMFCALPSPREAVGSRRAKLALRGRGWGSHHSLPEEPLLRCLPHYPPPPTPPRHARCAWREGSAHALAISPRVFARALPDSCRLAPEKGAGNAGRSMRPQSRVQDGVESAHEHTGHTGFTRHSPRNGLRLTSCSPRRSGWFVSVARRVASIDLTPASRRQDHTTSPSASGALVRGAISVHRIPPRVRDDRETPLWWGGTMDI